MENLGKFYVRYLHDQILIFEKKNAFAHRPDLFLSSLFRLMASPFH